MNYGQWVLLAAIIIAVVFFAVTGRKKRWYTIYLENNDMIMAYRQVGDWFWHDSSGMMGFRLPDGRHVKVSKSKIIKVVQEKESPKDLAK